MSLSLAIERSPLNYPILLSLLRTFQESEKWRTLYHILYIFAWYYYLNFRPINIESKLQNRG